LDSPSIHADHFEAYLGVASALGGILIGAGLEYVRQHYERRHEDSVRFHKERFDFYPRYRTALDVLLTAAKDWDSNGHVLPIRDALAKQIAAFNEIHARVLLLASPSVLFVVAKLTKDVRLITDYKPGTSQPLNDLIAGVDVTDTEFVNAARKELGSNSLGA
jgi:hypothetical protein